MTGKIIKGLYYLKDSGIAGYREVSRAEYDAAFPDVPPHAGPVDLNISTDWRHPVESDALCVHPDQVREARESAERHGVPTEFLEDGRPVFRSRQQRSAYLRAYGFYDRDAGYSDTTRGGTDATRG